MKSNWRPPPHATTYPRRRGDWTVAHTDGTFSSFSPETGSMRAVDPRKDPKLPALNTAIERGKLVAYRIGRRAVIATGDSYIKVVRPERSEALINAHRIGERANGTRVPAIIRSDPLGSSELTAMDGEALHQTVITGVIGLSTVESVAHAMASLHQVIVEQPDALPPYAPDEPTRWVETVARVDQHAADHLAKPAARLPGLGAGTASVIHGDLHDKNIFLGADTAGLIDLDGLSLGGAEFDIANLAVHLKLRMLQTNRDTRHAAWLASGLYDSYHAVRPIDRELAWAVEQHTWFRLACLYLLRRPNAELVARILDQLATS